MSKQEVKKESRVKTVKKSWFKIIAPQLFGAGELGETYLSSAESALGRTLRHNLKELTGNVKDQNAYLLFKIDKVQGTTLHTVPLGYELTASSVKRMVKKNTTRLDDCFTSVSKDGKKVAIKSVLITSIKIQRSVGKALKKTLQDTVNEDLHQNDFATFLANLAGGKLRHELRKRLAKIYPLKEAAIRAVTIIGTGTAPAVPTAETAATSEAEEIPADIAAETELPETNAAELEEATAEPLASS